MKIKHTNQRMQRYMLPGVPTACTYPKDCPYRVVGVCDEPRINKGNSDAACFGIANKTIAEFLTVIGDD